LQKKSVDFSEVQFKSILNGALEQEKDLKTETEADFHLVSKKALTDTEISDLIFANKIVKHQKSNTIVLVRGKQLIGSGTGQTSRVDALKQAIQKAHNFGFELKGAVMASDAFSLLPIRLRSHAGKVLLPLCSRVGPSRMLIQSAFAMNTKCQWFSPE
jgi:phosphoribosylaminoimidazolecarboxamide formyltransferase/IMP cyclohydrolase